MSNTPESTSQAAELGAVMLPVQADEESQAGSPAPTTGVRYASDEEVRRASEKVFRLHPRLFEALAK